MYYRTVIIFTFLSVLFLLPVNAANLYEWKDENGVMNITSTPPPQNVKKYNVERYRKDTKEEIEQYEKQRTQQQRDAAARTEANRRANQARQAQEESQSNLQRSRDQRADKVESDARERLRFVRDKGVKLPQANIDVLEKAAAAKADQIRKGTDTPISEREDIEFHMQQKINDLENEVRRKKY